MNIPALNLEQEPSWLQELRRQCEQQGRKKVGQIIGYSTGTLSQVLNDKYPGDIAKVERAVRGAFLGDTVMCPVVGEIGLHDCRKYHTGQPSTVNPIKVRLARTCPNCEHNSN